MNTNFWTKTSAAATVPTPRLGARIGHHFCAGWLARNIGPAATRPVPTALPAKQK